MLPLNTPTGRPPGTLQLLYLFQQSLFISLKHRAPRNAPSHTTQVIMQNNRSPEQPYAGDWGIHYTTHLPTHHNIQTPAPPRSSCKRCHRHKGCMRGSSFHMRHDLRAAPFCCRCRIGLISVP